MPRLVSAWMTDISVDQEDSNRAPQKEKKQPNLPKANSSPSLFPRKGDDLGGRSAGSPGPASSPFNLHLPPSSTNFLFLTRASDGNSCGPGAAGPGDGDGPPHTRTKTQLIKVEYGLTKNKRQVSCSPLGYTRWRGRGWDCGGGHRAGGTRGGLLSFSCLPPSEKPASRAPRIEAHPYPPAGTGSGSSRGYGGMLGRRETARINPQPLQIPPTDP